MGVLGTTNVSLNSAQVLYGATSGAQISMDATNIRYLAGIPQSASLSQINMNKLKGAAYFTKTSAGTAVDVRADCVAAGWNQSGPVWYIINGNTYSGSTGSAALTISGSFPSGIILQIASGVTVIGKGGNGGTGASGSGQTGGTAGAVGGVAIAVSTYSGGTLYINNLGTISGGGGGGGAGRGGYYVFGYSQTNYQGGGGGGGAGTGSGGANGGSAGGVTTAGAGGSGLGGITLAAGAGGSGGGLGSAGIASTYGAGGAGACTTGTVGVVTWIATGTRYGTVG